MRLLTFTLLAIAAGTGIDWGLGEIPYALANILGKIVLVSALLLPMIVTAGLAYAMRISNIIYVYFAVILSPFVSFILHVYIAVTFFHDHLL